MTFLPFEPAPSLARLFAAIGERRQRNRRTKVVKLDPTAERRAREILDRRSSNE